jgi:hypothetical protein
MYQISYAVIEDSSDKFPHKENKKKKKKKLNEKDVKKKDIPALSTFMLRIGRCSSVV